MVGVPAGVTAKPKEVTPGTWKATDAGTYSVNIAVELEDPDNYTLNEAGTSVGSEVNINWTINKATIGNIYRSLIVSSTDTTAEAELSFIPSWVELPASITQDPDHINGIVTATSISGRKIIFTLSPSENGGSGGATLPIDESTNYNAFAVYFTVLSTSKTLPTLSTSPITMDYTGSAPDLTSAGWTAEADGEAVEGTWAFVGTAPRNVADSGKHQVKFTPTDEDTYTPATAEVQITIDPAELEGPPTLIPLTESKSLSEAAQTNLKSSWTFGGIEVSGYFTLSDGPDPVKQGESYVWTFTPNSSNDQRATGSVVLWPNAEFTVTLDPDGGTVSSTTLTAEEGQSVTLPEAPSGPATNTSTTTQNPDGSTTKTTTSPAGTATETRKPDGSTEKVETQKDGTVTETNTTPEGVTASTTTNPGGRLTEAKANIPASAAQEAAQRGETITLPARVPAQSKSEAVPMQITVPRTETPLRVEIPVENPGSTTVAILVRDGAEVILQNALVTGEGLEVQLNGSARIKILDNAKYFQDVSGGHWAKDVVDFVTSRELFNGTSAGNLNPGNNATRAHVAAMVARFSSYMAKR